MPIGDATYRIPLSVLVARSKEEEEHYLQRFDALPPGIKSLITSPRAGFYLSGLLKVYTVTPEHLPAVLLMVLQVAFGERTFAQFPVLLSTELKIPNDKAQAMASEIEKELFSPVLLELNQYLVQKKQAGKSPFRTEHSPLSGPSTSLPTAPLSPSVPGGTMRNVLDLKNKPLQQPKPPAVPR